MSGKRILIHSIFLYLASLVVAAEGLSIAAAAGIVMLLLLWRWAISLSAIALPADMPALELETITASHFVEKVRWCMDRLGVEYNERQVGGALGAFFLGRTVPRLWMRTGAVRSSIGNSPEILRYLWGRYAVEFGQRARFLEPTAERLAMEQSIDRCGVDLQVWVYHHILNERQLTQQAWGCNSPDIPLWQRWTLKLLFPLLRFMIRKSFRITPAHHARAVQHIDALLADVEQRLEDGRTSILGGTETDYIDITFASIMGLWAQPAAYGGGRTEAVKIEDGRLPDAMREEVARWRSLYPRASAFIDTLYASQRLAGEGSPAVAQATE